MQRAFKFVYLFNVWVARDREFRAVEATNNKFGGRPLSAELVAT